jgi:hypothetical protein
MSRNQHHDQATDPEKFLIETLADALKAYREWSQFLNELE